MYRKCRTLSSADRGCCCPSAAAACSPGGANSTLNLPVVPNLPCAAHAHTMSVSSIHCCCQPLPTCLDEQVMHVDRCAMCCCSDTCASLLIKDMLAALSLPHLYDARLPTPCQHLCAFKERDVTLLLEEALAHGRAAVRGYAGDVALALLELHITGSTTTGASTCSDVPIKPSRASQEGVQSPQAARARLPPSMLARQCADSPIRQTNQGQTLQKRPKIPVRRPDDSSSVCVWTLTYVQACVSRHIQGAASP